MALTLGALGAGAASALDTVADQRDPAWVRRFDRQYEHFACLEKSFRAKVPAGSRVLLSAHNGTYRQRLVEWATPDYTPVLTPPQADFRVRTVVDRRTKCGGVRLDVVPVASGGPHR